MRIRKSSSLKRRLLAAIAAAVSFGAASQTAIAFLNGIDVYVGDNGNNNVQPVNWTTVKNGGYSFAFVKADEGTELFDGAFDVNMAGANANGIYVGPYHLGHTESLSPTGSPNFNTYTG